MAEDSPAQPLPQRVPAGDRQIPGGRQEPDGGPVRPAVLSKDVLWRIRDALGSMKDEASPEGPPAPAKRPASLPRRVPGAGKGPQPPAVIARPRLPFLPRPLPRSRAGEAAADDSPALSVSHVGGVTEEIAGRPDARTEEIAGRPDARTEEIAGRPDARTEEIAGRPDARTEEIAGRPDARTERIAWWPDATTEGIAGRAAPAPRPREAELPDRHDHTDGETGRPGKAPSHQENGQARRVKRPARRAKVLGRRAKVSAPDPKPAPSARPSRPRKPAPRKAPAFPGEPTAQVAALFPDESAPEEATPRPPALSWPHRVPWGRRIVWLGLVLVLVSTGSLALLLAR